MARIRTIKPEFPHSESMGRVSRDARLLFILLWTLADDGGRLRGNSRILASLLYPYDTDAQKLIDKWILDLEKEKCVVRYIVDDSTYLQILNWTTHQKIDKPTPSKIPEFDEASRILSTDSRDVVMGSGSGSGSGSVSGREGKGPAIPEGVNTEAFEKWIGYRKAERHPVGHHSYEALFKKFMKLGDHGAQMAAVEHSVANSYQGVYPESRLSNGIGAHKPTVKAKTIEEIEAEEAARVQH